MVGVGVGGVMITTSYHGQPQVSRSLLGSVNLNAIVNASAGAVIVGDYGTIYVTPVRFVGSYPAKFEHYNDVSRSLVHKGRNAADRGGAWNLAVYVSVVS